MAPAMASTETDMEEQFLEAGNKLVDSPSTVEELLLLQDANNTILQSDALHDPMSPPINPE